MGNVIHKAFKSQIVNIDNISESKIAKNYTTEDGRIQLPSNVSVQLVDEEETVRTYDLMDLLSKKNEVEEAIEKLVSYRRELNDKLENSWSATDEDEYLRDDISNKITELRKLRITILSVLKLYRYWQIKEELNECQFGSIIGIYGITKNKEN